MYMDFYKPVTKTYRNIGLLSLQVGPKPLVYIFNNSKYHKSVSSLVEVSQPTVERKAG